MEWVIAAVYYLSKFSSQHLAITNNTTGMRPHDNDLKNNFINFKNTLNISAMLALVYVCSSRNMATFYQLKAKYAYLLLCNWCKTRVLAKRLSYYNEI